MGKLLASQRFHLFHLVLAFFSPAYCETNGWSLLLFSSTFVCFYISSEIQTNNETLLLLLLLAFDP